MKKILLSIVVIGASFFSQAQTLFTDNFDALTVGNLGTDLTGAIPGQGNWGTYVPTGGANTDFQIVNAGATDNELQLTGPAGATSTSTTKYAFQYFDWAGRTPGNDVIFTEFKIKTGPTGITSTNDFRVAIYNDAWSKVLAGVSFNAKTKLITGILYAVGGGGAGTYVVNIGNGGLAVPALTANSEITIQIAFDKISGNVFWSGSGAGQTFSYSASGGGIGENPGEIDVFVRGGSGNTSSTTCSFDDFIVKAQPCADPSLTSRDAAVSINYSSASYCKDLASVVPTISPLTTGGTFYSPTALNFVGQTTPGQSSTGEINPSASTAGGYIITYYTAGSATSCSYIARDTVTIKAMPAIPSVVTSGSTTFCASSSVILSTPAALNTSYLWSNSTNNDSTTVNTSGNYTVTATTNGCSTTSLATNVTVNPLPAAPVITPNGSLGICSGGTVGLSSESASSYNWSTGETTQAITASAIGTYSVSITDANGCVSPNGSVNVTANPTQDASFSYVSNTLCVSGGTASATKVDPTLNGTFSSTSGLDIDPSTGLITPSNSTPGQYTVTYTTNSTSTSCTDTKTQIINITNSPVATFNYSAASYCNYESNQAVSFTGGGTAGAFSSTSGLSVNTSNGLIDVAQSTPGNYVVTNTINVSGCALTTATANVEIKATPTVTVSAPAVCAGTTASVTANPGVAGTYTYAWTVPTGTAPANTVSTFNPTAAGQYSVVITNPTTGCTSQSAIATLTINALPTVSVTALPVCAGTTATVTANPGVAGTYTYTWTVPSGTAPATTVSTFNPTAAGQYSVVITNPTTMCSSQIANATLTINALPSAPVITPNGPTTFCQGGNVILSSSTANGYTWSNQATSQTITVTASGNYSVTITDGNGCTNVSAPTSVTVNSCAGIEENTNNTFVVYPNPANDVINVTFSSVSENGTVELFTADGKVIESKEISDSMTETFNVVNLNSGVYYIVITSDNGRVSQKVIIE
jgi:hypothetical protein